LCTLLKEGICRGVSGITCRFFFPILKLVLEKIRHSHSVS
jgi:hypothetical protein